MPIYTGVSGANKEVKRAIVGVSGVNREIKQGYVGVSGANRPIFTAVVGGTLTVSGYESTATQKNYFSTGVVRASYYADPSIWTIIFDRNFTFNAGRIASISKYNACTFYNMTTRWIFGSLTTSPTKDAIQTGSLPSANAPMTTNKIGFRIDMSRVMDTNADRNDITLSGWYIYPVEYPKGLKLDMSKLISTRANGTVKSQPVSFIELS